MLLAVIGNSWLDAVDEHNRRRLNDPDDLIVLEIANALQRNIRVIPVLVEGAPQPRRDDLPEILAPLARRQAIRLDHVGFNATMTALLTALERALASAKDEVGRGRVIPDNDRHVPRNTPAVRQSVHEWTVDDFALLLQDQRSSTQRIAEILDTLAEQPDVEIALSSLAAAIGTSRSELRGSFRVLTNLCKRLRPDIDYDWPIIWRHGPSTHPGQSQETWYRIPRDVAERWIRTRRRRRAGTNGRADRSDPATATATTQARSKGAAYSAFWATMLDCIRTEHPDWTNARSPGSQNWFAMPSPFRGDTQYVLNFGRHNQLRSELYIDHVDPARVAAIYAALYHHKDRIEHVYGEPLVWEELPAKRASRIAACTDIGGDVFDTDLHDQYRNWFLDTLQRLRTAIGDVLPQVQAQLKITTTSTPSRT